MFLAACGPTGHTETSESLPEDPDLALVEKIEAIRATLDTLHGPRGEKYATSWGMSLDQAIGMQSNALAAFERDLAGVEMTPEEHVAQLTELIEQANRDGDEEAAEGLSNALNWIRENELGESVDGGVAASSVPCPGVPVFADKPVKFEWRQYRTIGFPGGGTDMLEFKVQDDALRVAASEEHGPRYVAHP